MAHTPFLLISFTAPAHKTRGGARSGGEQCGLLLPPPQRLSACMSRLLQLLPFPNNPVRPPAPSVLAFGLPCFRPTLGSPPISLCVWVSPSPLPSGPLWSGHSNCLSFPLPSPLLPPSPPPSSGGCLRGPQGWRQWRRNGARGRRPNRCSRTRGRPPEHSASPGAGAEAGAGEAVWGGEERTPAAPQKVPRR